MNLSNKYFWKLFLKKNKIETILKTNFLEQFLKTILN